MNRFCLKIVSGALAAFFSVGLVVQGQDAPPPPPPPRDQSAPDLKLTPDQQRQLDAALVELHRKQKAADDDFSAAIAKILSPGQLRQFRAGAGQAARQLPGADAPKGTVVFTGGYDTDPRDHGRPVVLIAAALKVPEDVFRKAFSGVKPAPAGEEPQEDQVRRNKQTLLDALGPYGVDDDRLNEVSNFYRYNGSGGQMWKNTPAKATAIITDGKVTGFTITDPGAGYSSAPTVSVVGYDVKAKVELNFETDLAKTGSVKSITVIP
jgi:hypothetical protein